MFPNWAPASSSAFLRLWRAQWNVREGSAIEIIPRGDHIVLRKESYDLAEMLAQVTAGNLHSEQDSGPAQGGEAW